MEKEIWKVVRDTDYKVSNYGNIMKPDGKLINFTSKKYRRCKVGYVHRLVAYYFCNPPEGTMENGVCHGYEIHHIDKDPSNNYYENLVYLPREEHKKIHEHKVVSHSGSKRIRKQTEINPQLILDFLNSLRK